MSKIPQNSEDRSTKPDLSKRRMGEKRSALIPIANVKKASDGACFLPIRFHPACRNTDSSVIIRAEVLKPNILN
jgi:hypothetical protein